MQCSGSNIAAALIEAVDKHNARNPESRIIYINCGAVATELTNEKCSFWHFRFDCQFGDEGRGHGACAAQGRHQDLPAQPGLPVRPVGAARRQGVARQDQARRAGGGRRADPARQGQGLRALHHQDQGIRRAGAADRQLGPGHEPPDQGRHRCRRRPALLHDVRPSRGRPHGDRAGRRRQGVLGDVLRRERGARDRQQGSRSLDGGVPRKVSLRLLRRRASAPSSSTCRRPPRRRARSMRPRSPSPSRACSTRTSSASTR